jgi:hypothetical protein
MENKRKRGRPLGSIKRIGKDAKDAMRAIYMENIPELRKCLANMEPGKEKAKLLIDIANFTVARQTATSFDATIARISTDDEVFKKKLTEIILADHARLEQINSRQLHIPPAQGSTGTPSNDAGYIDHEEAG